MNKTSKQRLIVFVTPAEKRAISTTAHGLGISVSELLLRALLTFDATAEQVRAARIMDSWTARQAPDTLDHALRQIAATAGPPPAASSSPAIGAHAGEPSAQQSLSVVADVVRAIELQDERGDEGQYKGACLDVQTVARMTASWAAAGTRDGDNAPAFDGEWTIIPTAKQARTGS